MEENEEPGRPTPNQPPPPQHPQEQHEQPTPQKQREHGLASFFASIALSLVWACVILLVLLAGFNQAMLSLEASHAAWASPPGNLFDVGGYKLHLYCKGTRTAQKPLTVVLIPREGMSHNEHWSAVESLSSTMRSCTYDRNGLGFSQTAPSYHPVNTRSLTTMAKELETLLQKGGETGAFLLVGRGLGANIAEQFAIDFTAQVGGVVLLDGMHADMFSLDEGSWLHYWHKHLVDDLLYSSYLMSAMGLNRVWHAMGLMSPAIAMIEAPAHVPSQQRHFLSQSKHCRAVLEEYASLPKALLQRAKQPNSFPLSLPTMLLFSEAFDSSLSPRLNELWWRSQASLAREHPTAEQALYLKNWEFYSPSSTWSNISSYHLILSPTEQLLISICPTTKKSLTSKRPSSSSLTQPFVFFSFLFFCLFLFFVFFRESKETGTTTTATARA